MEHGIFSSVQDFVDEGTAAVLDRVTAPKMSEQRDGTGFFRLASGDIKQLL